MLLEKYFPELSSEKQKQFESLLPLYKNWNEKINVISRKDIDNFFVHHVLHSLAIAKFISFKPKTSVLDFGTGGGFPGVPLAIMFPETEFLLVDSIGKKLKVVDEVVKELNLKNVTTLHSRVEQLNRQFDFITCRAVTDLKNIFQWTNKLISPSLPLPKGKGTYATKKNEVENGWLLLKGGDLNEELKSIRRVLQQISISEYFDEDYFKEKQLLYFPL